MPSNQAIFMGIDPSIQGGLLAYAHLDIHLHPTMVGLGGLEEVLGIVGEMQPKMIGIGAPPNLNGGIISNSDKRIERGIPIGRGRPMDCRVGEFEILQRGIEIYRTPSLEEKTKGWMREGFEVYKRLETMGFSSYHENSGGQLWIEAPTETCYWLWLERKPMAPDSLEGRIQRQLSLYDLGMDIPDPMLFFEEITRYRLLKGILVEDGLYASAELHALAGAYMAWAVIQRPEEVTFLGDAEEGQFAVPNKFNPK